MRVTHRQCLTRSFGARGRVTATRDGHRVRRVMRRARAARTGADGRALGLTG